MKKIILLLSFIALYASAFTQDSSQVKNQSLPFFSCCYFPLKEPEKPKIFIRCASSNLGEPLYVIDGEVASMAELRKVDPDNIDSIWVLKYPSATTIYGLRGVNGVIVITTKKTDERIIEIRDKKTGEPLPFATIEITRIGKWRTDRFTADSLGQVKIKIMPDHGYELVASYVGYENSKKLISSRKKEKQGLIYLERVNPAGTIKNIKLYPNPVLRSQRVSIEFENARENKATLKLFSLDGKLIGMKEYGMIKGKNKINYSIDAQVAAGIYAIQLIGEGDKLLKTEKLIIQ